MPRLAIALPETGARLDPAALFPGAVRAVWLEVGFGGGEHLAWQAQQHPDTGMIGSEVFENGIAGLLGHVDRDGLANVRIFNDDVRHLLAVLPDRCIERVFVLFPDPWPKKRHAERRFVNDANLDHLFRVMIDGGELRLATDDPTYKAWASQRMAARADFIDVTEDPLVKGGDWPATRYEMKALAGGRQPIYLRFLRRGG